MNESPHNSLRGRLLTTALYINEVLAHADAANERAAMTDKMASLLARAKVNLVATSNDSQLITDIATTLAFHDAMKEGK